MLVVSLFATAMFAAEYDLWVAGMRINDDNKDNIIGALQNDFAGNSNYAFEGQMWYDAENQVLTLKNVYMKCYETVGIESKIEVNTNKKNFTVLCVGRNYINSRKGGINFYGSATNADGKNIISGDTLIFDGGVAEGVVGIYCKNGSETGGNGKLCIRHIRCLDITAAKWGIYAWELPVFIEFSNVKILAGTNDAIARAKKLEIVASQLELKSVSGYAGNMIQEIKTYWSLPESGTYELGNGNIIYKNGSSLKEAKWTIWNGYKTSPDLKEEWILFGKYTDVAKLSSGDITSTFKSQTNTKLSGKIEWNSAAYKMTWTDVDYEITRIDTEKDSPFSIFNYEKSNPNLTIELKGNNTITTKNSMMTPFYMHERNIRFTGNGTLKIETDAPAAMDLLDGAQLWIVGDDSDNHPTVIINGKYYGLRGNAVARDYNMGLVVNNAELTLVGGEAAMSYVANVTIPPALNIISAGVAYDENAKTFVKDGEPANEVKIGFGEPEQEGIDNVQTDKAQCTKVMENGALYLMYKGTKYNVQGAQVK